MGQIKYISEDERLDLDETREVVHSLYSKLEQMGAERVESYLTEGSNFEFKGTYEFPRQGSVSVHLKAYATIPSQNNYPKSLNYNVLVNLLSFREDTQKYKKIKSSIEDVLLTEAFDKIQ